MEGIQETGFTMGDSSELGGRFWAALAILLTRVSLGSCSNNKVTTSFFVGCLAIAPSCKGCPCSPSTLLTS